MQKKAVLFEKNSIEKRENILIVPTLYLRYSACFGKINRVEIYILLFPPELSKQIIIKKMN